MKHEICRPKSNSNLLAKLFQPGFINADGAMPESGSRIGFEKSVLFSYICTQN